MIHLPFVRAARYRATNQRHTTEHARICREKRDLQERLQLADHENAALLIENAILHAQTVPAGGAR